MRCCFLEKIEGRTESEIESLLSKELPEQRHPWVLFDRDGTPISYLNLSRERRPLCIQADVSGRHGIQGMETTIEALKRLQILLGGVIRDDDGKII